MGSRALVEAVRATILVAAGAAAMLAWREGLYASLVLAVLVALWVATVQVAKHPAVLPAPAAAPHDGGSEDARERRRLSAYLNLSPAPLVTLNRTGRLRTINRAARQLFAAEDLIPAPPAGLVAAIETAPAGRAATVQFAAPGTRSRPFAILTAELAVGSDGARIAALIDIEAELKAAEAATLRDLLQVLSHEIMNALTPIASLGRTAAELLRDDAAASEAARDAVETVARRAEGLQRFSAAYRELARLPAPTPARFALRPFLGDLEQLFRTRWPAEIALSVDLAQAPATLRGDADQLSAALWAILQNAAEAVLGRPDAAVTLTARAATGALVVTVEDNGAGVPPDLAEAIFRPFFTSKPEGSGVGLALAAQIVQAHRGSCELAPGSGGACFVVTLPD